MFYLLLTLDALKHPVRYFDVFDLHFVHFQGVLLQHDEVCLLAHLEGAELVLDTQDLGC